MKKCKGEITVFLSLLLLLVLSLLFAVLESAHVSASKALALGASDLVGFSALAEYHRELFDDWEVFYIDGGYAKEQLSIEAMEEEMKLLLGEQFARPGERWTSNSISFMNPSIQDCHVSDYRLMTDHKGRDFRRQAAEYMEGMLDVLVINRLMDLLNKSEDLEDKENKLEKEILDVEQNLVMQGRFQRAADYPLVSKFQLKNHIFVDDMDTAKITEEEKDELLNLWNQIKEFSTKGILNFVISKDTKISKNKIVLSQQPSKRELQTGTGEEEVPGEGITDEIFFHEYIMEKCSSFLNGPDEKKDDIIQYQVEYILQGKSGDMENLKGVVNKLLLIRSALNFAYLLSDTGKCAQADTAAFVLTTLLGVPYTSAIVQKALLLIWAFGESILDIRSLLAGKKVPFYKSSSSWKVSWSSLLKLDRLFSTKEDAGSSDTNGVSYQDYLRILLYLSSDNSNTMRTLDVLEQSIRSKTGDKSFYVDHCISRFKLDTGWSIPSMFGRMSMLPTEGGSREYNYETSKVFAY